MASKPMTDPKKLVGRLERVVLDRRPGFSLNADPQLLTEAAACIREMVEKIAMLEDELEVANLYPAPGAEA